MNINESEMCAISITWTYKYLIRRDGDSAAKVGKESGKEVSDEVSRWDQYRIPYGIPS